MTAKMVAKKVNNLISKIIIINVICSVIYQADGSNSAMDDNLYEQVIDATACEEQMNYITTNDTILRARFMDASLRIPRGILQGNLRDMGNYYQCLDLNKEHLDMIVEGKYCVIHILLNQNIHMPGIGPMFPWAEEHWNEFYEKKTSVKDTFDLIKSNEGGKDNVNSAFENAEKYTRNNLLTVNQFQLAICIPKVCSTQQALRILTNNVSLYFDIREDFCRLPNDKPWVAADYVAISIFSALGILTLVSTTYDVRHMLVLKRDPKQVNKLYATFSAYSNAKKFFTFHYNSNALNCLDGIRSIAMLWVIIGHTFSTQLFLGAANPLDMFQLMTSFSALWLTAAPITVDTFLMIAGLLLIYTSAPKLTSRSLLKNLHLFYLNRYLRMFPVLATAVLLQASLLNHVTDGPNWGLIAKTVTDCRTNWWTTLLYVHNYISFGYLCVQHSWYLAIDMQLYIISPLVLIWVVSGNKRAAWTALIVSFLLVLTTSTIFNFIMEFQSAAVSAHPEEKNYYTQYYYINTLTRAAPFFVGMIFGYILHLCRGKYVRIPKVQIILIWLLAFGTTTTVVISHYFPLQPEWDNQTVDSILNSFMRPAWAAGVAWLVFACAHGYAGPIDWFLSLHIFKILGRLSYAMFVLHLPIVYLTNSTVIAPMYFSVEFSIQKFMVDLNLTIFVSLLVTILIDLPFSNLIGIFIGSKKDKENRVASKNTDVNV